MELKLFEIRYCLTCEVEMKLKIVQKGLRKGLLDKKIINKRFCSVKCQNEWQTTTSWDERIGVDRANEIRKERSLQVSGENNPSKDPLVASKISNSMKLYLQDNPRIGNKNGFFGKEHTSEYKDWASLSRKDIRSYDDSGYKKQNENTPKKENHPNWKGGVSFEAYDFSFDQKMKNYIKTRDMFECQICSKKDVKFHIHHIDYDKKNSNERNLITLCNSCHSKTNWRRECWKEFFKPIIYKKYNNQDQEI